MMYDPRVIVPVPERINRVSFVETPASNPVAVNVVDDVLPAVPFNTVEPKRGS
jgi:hypothetical protein